MRLRKTPLTAALHGLVPAARDSAHAIDVRGGSPCPRQRARASAGGAAATSQPAARFRPGAAAKSSGPTSGPCASTATSYAWSSGRPRDHRLGQGVLTSEGQLWQRQRRLIQPLFTRKQIATYATLMAEEAGRTAERWDRAAGQRGTVDAHGEMIRLTLRSSGGPSSARTSSTPPM
jgi:hypothetical protein